MRSVPRNPAVRRGASRRGAFLIVAMVCLLLAGLLLSSVLKLAVLQEQQLGFEKSRLQAAWLAESGLERAAARLAQEPGYSGETWKISAARLGGADAAVVVIRVQQTKTEESRRAIVVEATYPAEGPHHARLTGDAIVSVSKES